ncbi:MAG TPA: response regulator [Lacunisphaera sp.]|nr:response regulator [Lacunisphaera sp.]
MQKAQILIVEDDPLVSFTLSQWIVHFGYSAVVADSTVEADRILSERSFDLILSDVHLPGNHQLQWVEGMLASDLTPPIVLITGNPELDSTMRAANLPIAGYLVKPPDLALLNQLIQRLVGEYRRRMEFRALSREAAWLLTTPEYRDPSDEPLRAKLLQLSQCLAAEAGRSPRESNHQYANSVWRTAIDETVGILEKTKHSFRSKELGQLRIRLQQMLQQNEAA